nr:sigma-70 family RNA polymerase sigma factor [Planosporangium thailandense]
MAAYPERSAERARLRAEAIELALPLVGRLARRFRGRGEPPDDLRQAGALALVKAVDNYDPARCVPFTGYAIPCLLGAFKRHFRDNGWDLRVPRPMQERQREIEHAAAELTQRLRRSPTPDELAVALGMTTDDVIVGLATRQAYDAVSLNEPVGDDAGGGERQDALGGPDARLEEVADRISLGPLLQRLPERERVIVTRRFFGNLSQSEIAAELGISQMQVSRILAQVLGWLRRVLRDDEVAVYPGASVDHPLTVRVAMTGTTLVAAVEGTVDVQCVQYLRTRLVRAVIGHRPRRFVVDLYEVPGMTTAGAAALMAARSACGHVGAHLRLARVSPPVARVLQRTGVIRVLAGAPPRATRPQPSAAAQSA